MEQRQRRTCSRIRCGRNRCARISASASTPAPERGADPRRPRYAPGRTRRSRSHRQCRQKARAAAHHAPRPGLFLLPHLPACRLPGLPDQQTGQALGVVPPPGKSWKVPGERWAQCMDIAQTTCTGKDQHRQRRTRWPRQQQTAAHDDHAPAPALHHLHSAHSLPALPDLTAAASAHRLHPSSAAHPAALPPACRSRSAPPTTAKRPKTSPPRPVAGGVRFFTYPAYRLCSIAVS